MSRRSEMYPCQFLVQFTEDDKKRLQAIVAHVRSQEPPETRRLISGNEVIRRLIRQHPLPKKTRKP